MATDDALVPTLKDLSKYVNANTVELFSLLFDSLRAFYLLFQ